MTTKKNGPVSKAATLGDSTGGIRRGDDREPERVLWQNEDWLVTPTGLRSRWMTKWIVPAHKLLQLRDLAAANLPHDSELHRIPFISALQAALAAHHPGVETIKEAAERNAASPVTSAKQVRARAAK